MAAALKFFLLLSNTGNYAFWPHFPVWIYFKFFILFNQHLTRRDTVATKWSGKILSKT